MRIYLILLFTLFSVFTNAQDSTFLKKVNAHRAQQNSEKRDSLHSPLKEEDRLKFESLYFFNPDEKYAVNCKFKTKIGDVFDMATSSGKVRKYRKYGELKFKLNGKKFKLNVYQSMSLLKNPIYKNYLFIPFTDNTNGEESYIGGRYIDFTIPNYKVVELDFNLSYNPYCAYNDGFSCPIPPKENYLNVRIEAGEKAFKTH